MHGASQANGLHPLIKMEEESRLSGSDVPSWTSPPSPNTLLYFKQRVNAAIRVWPVNVLLVTRLPGQLKEPRNMAWFTTLGQRPYSAQTSGSV